MSLSPQVCKKNYKVHIPSLGEECEFWLVRVTDEQSITNPDKDHAYYTDDGKLFIYDGKNLVRVNCDICFTQEEREKLEDIEEGANKYVLPVANDSSLGGIKTGFTQTEKKYAVEVTEEGQAYVTVPWTDTIYTLPVADTDTLGGVKLGYSQNGKNYPVLKDENGNIYVAVPWVEYQLQQASAETLGGIKTGYQEQGKNYAVTVDIDGNAYVTVPWSDTVDTYEVVSQDVNGLAPMLPSEDGETKFLRGDATWASAPSNSYTLPQATSTTLGGVTIGSNISVSNGKISIDKTDVTNALGSTPLTRNEIVNLIYPVGSIYISTSSTNPGSLFGGTWQAYGQGRTLIGAGTGNDGSTSMSFTANGSGGKYYSDQLNSPSKYWGLTSSNFGYEDRLIIRKDPIGGTQERSAKISLVQPYIVTYFWRRTA